MLFSEHFIQDSRTIQLRDLCNKGFEKSEGPFVRSLDKALGAMNVHRQAYYGGTFIGNHVHKCMALSSDYHQMYNSAEKMTCTAADVLCMNLHTCTIFVLALNCYYLIYRCSYCQVSLISFYISSSHSITQNALFRGSHSLLD